MRFFSRIEHLDLGADAKQQRLIIIILVFCFCLKLFSVNFFFCTGVGTLLLAHWIPRFRG